MQKLFKTELSAYIPFCLPNILDRKIMMDEFTAGISEFVSFSGTLKIKFTNNYIAGLNADLFNTPDEIPVFQKHWEGKISPFYEFWFVKFSTSFEFSAQDVEKGFHDSPGDDPEKLKEMCKWFAGVQLEHLCNELLLALSIAKLGLIRSERGLVFCDDLFISKTKGSYSQLYRTKEWSLKTGWPPIKNMSLERVWKWLIEFDFFHTQIGEGPIGRAIASISYLLKDTFGESLEDYNLDIIWILIGLESLYGKGNVGSKNQIIEKTKVFLGEPKNYKKALGKAYDLRSRVVHGDVDLPFSYCDGYEQTETLSSDLDDARIITLSVLISTIQKLIEDGKKSLNFKYQLI